MWKEIYVFFPIYIKLFFAYIKLTYFKFPHISRKFFAFKKLKMSGPKGIVNQIDCTDSVTNDQIFLLLSQDLQSYRIKILQSQDVFHRVDWLTVWHNIVNQVNWLTVTNDEIFLSPSQDLQSYRVKILWTQDIFLYAFHRVNWSTVWYNIVDHVDQLTFLQMIKYFFY